MMERPLPVARAEAYRNLSGPALGIEALIIAGISGDSSIYSALLEFANARVIYALREVMAWKVLQPENRPESQVQVIAGLRAR